MQIIQKIRDKGAAIVIGVIALSLIGFILMDANLGANRSSTGNGATVGEINGSPVDSKDYQDRIKQIEDQYGGRMSGPQLYYIRQNAWDQMVTEKVLNTEFEKLGLVFSPKELTSIIFSNDAPQTLKQAFTNKTTGQYDIAKVQEWWQNAKKSKGEQRDALEKQIVEPVMFQALVNKYSSMIAASAYYPSWLKEKEAKEATTFANVSYVAIPYSTITDSTIKVTDDDITSYVSKHAAMYKQDGGRLLSYVAFSAIANAADTAAALSGVENLKNAFSADTNAKVFLTVNASAKPFEDVYVPKSKLTMAQKDTIASLPKDATFGPYIDGSDFVIAKMIGTKTLPDSIKCRHILIGTADRQTGQALMTDSAAKKRADSVELAINSGANFDELEAKYSTDEAAHKDKGVMTFDVATIQDKEKFAAEFGEFLMNEKGETRKVIKTGFGYHYIEILEKKNPQTTYKIAYLAKEISASEETINAASAQASKLSAEARDIKALDAYVAKNHLQKVDVPNLIKESDFQLGGLQDAREIVRWAFGAKAGDVSETQFKSGEQFIVGAVDKIVPAGLPDAKSARPMTELLVRNQKKAEQIKTKLTATPTLESAAAAYSKTVAIAGADSSLTFTSTIINEIGQEPKVIGAAFNKAYQAKASEPIVGTSGVYVIKVNSTGTKATDTPEVAAQKESDRKKALAQQVNSGWFEALKKLSVIKDERSKFN